jgi:spermidine synthase
MSVPSIPAPPIADARRCFPALLLLFAASGCSALIYEVVWYQLLQLAIGSTAVSMGVLLATFMGGLCIGSLALPRLSLTGRHPLRVYAWLEAGIAASGLSVLVTLPLINRVYVAGLAGGLPGMLLRAILAAVCMLIPTILMGASLPAVARWIDATAQGVSWWGLLYGGNTAGAVAGCLIAGFYLLRIHDTYVATYAAAALNLAVAALSLALAGRVPATSGGGDAAPAETGAGMGASPGPWPVYAAIAISGACALGAEVEWTRLMGMLLGATVYAFSIILAVFLIGLAAGSGVAALILRSMTPRLVKARRALGWSQILASFGVAWTAYMIAHSLPYWPIDVMLTKSPWQLFQLDMARSLWAILPATLFWGASFPLALAAAPGADHSRQDHGRTVGAVYAANTLGAIAGALGTSLALVPWIGTQNSQRVLLAASALGALVMLAPDLRSRRSAAALAVALAASGWLAWRVDAVPGKLIAYGRQMPRFSSDSQIVQIAEGRNSSIAIGQWGDGSFEIDVNGHIEATTEPFDMSLQRMVGHLPGLLHPDPKSVLGIGFGAGVSAGAFTRYPGIGKITVCEIEPVIPPISARYFAAQNYGVFHNPKTRVVFDDARHYLMTTTEKYDIIASDPLDVFVKGTAGLYSKEYFEAVKRHLNPGGYFTLYVPLYESDRPTVQSELATFFDAFPNATVWGNTRDGRGYDMVFLGQVEPLKIDLDEVYARLARPDYAEVAASLREVDFHAAARLFATYMGQKSDLGKWTEGAAINRDRDLRLQYLAGWGINSQLQDTLYSEMLKYRRTPSNIFIGSPNLVSEVLAAIMRGQ